MIIPRACPWWTRRNPPPKPNPEPEPEPPKMPTLRDFIAAADAAATKAAASAAVAVESAKQAAHDALTSEADSEALKAAETAEVNALTKVGGVAFDPATGTQYTIADGKVVSAPAVTLDVEIRSDSGGPVDPPVEPTPAE